MDDPADYDRVLLLRKRERLWEWKRLRLRQWLRRLLLTSVCLLPAGVLRTPAGEVPLDLFPRFCYHRGVNFISG